MLITSKTCIEVDQLTNIPLDKDSYNFIIILSAES